MNGIICQVLILDMILFRLLTKVIGIETAFLYGELEEEIYIKYPPGMKCVGCVILNKCIYGLVQATRQYNKKAVEILMKAGFATCNVDLCLNMKRSKKCTLYVGLYKGDNLMI